MVSQIFSATLHSQDWTRINNNFSARPIKDILYYIWTWSSTYLGYYTDINIATTSQVIKNTRAYRLTNKFYSFISLQINSITLYCILINMKCLTRYSSQEIFSYSSTWNEKSADTFPWTTEDCFESNSSVGDFSFV